MLTLLIHALLFVLGVVTGAYSHKWLGKVSGAPANVTLSNVGELPAAAVKAAKAVAGVKPSAPTTKG
jgi:hypothetical protein